ncbi:MAG: RNA methyltransferase, partial [Acidimicrobiales bacterium]
RIRTVAAKRGITIERVTERRVTAIARSSRHHQGVVADVIAPAMAPLSSFLERRRGGREWATTVLLLDTIHNPANVGMVLRTAVAAGIDGIIVPTRGTADIGPIAIKASAGVAFRAPVLRADTSVEAVAALRDARFAVVGLDLGGGDLYEAELPDRVCFVMGNESSGLSVKPDYSLSIPLVGGVESLNVATAAAVLCFELVRRSRD